MKTRKFYRSRHGKIFGLCQGLAEYRDLPVGGIRLLLIILALCTAVVPCLLIYILLGIIIPVNPYEEYDGEDFENLKDRVDRMERKKSKYDKEKDWDDRFYS